MYYGQADLPNAGDLLSRYRIFRTRDLDEARELVGKVYTSHELDFAAPGRRQLDTSMSHCPIGGISLNRLRYGGKVNIDVGCLGSFLLVMMPMTGCAQIRCGDQSILSSPRLASVISPTLPLRKTIDADCDQIMVRIDRELLERICAQQLGHELPRPLQFDLGFNLADNSSHGWRALLSYLLTEADRASPFLQSPLVCVQIEHLAVMTLLFSQNHNYRQALVQPATAAAPRHVRRVEEYIDAHADQPLTIAELAAYAKVSASSLYEGFRAFRNISPMAYLKQVRMRRIREDLRSADANAETVTEIAMRWGFAHLGRFSTHYKKMFGESPSETLRNAS